MQVGNITLTINGRQHRVEVRSNETLLELLRRLGYMDVKSGCDKGDCGACAVLFNGEAVNSCLVLAAQARDAVVVTSAGLGTLDDPHPLQEAFADAGAAQCGFCTPGMVVSAKALLDRNPHPTEEEIREAISGNLCRCTGYAQIVKAIQMAAIQMAAIQMAGGQTGAVQVAAGQMDERGGGS